ncbi:flagella assembly protein FlgT middle domain-containing protein [uncultured Shewanella sp.]|uniref:flagella assembly protein FlgT middle domain-containing protein n=1 Tax=uncultured Shewanella sp. TaxID=173975 RepID=UPI00262F5FF9|nr:flagella assembly protein FlgT middle domain-containing protein [uncultured Shewanella sp.]
MFTQSIPFITACLLVSSLLCHASSAQSELQQAAPASPCLSTIKASILVPQAQMQDRSQLRYGQIGHFEQHLSQRLTQQLKFNLQHGIALAFSNERLDFSPSLSSTHNTRLPDWLNTITNSQYLLIPSIDNIATDNARYVFGLWETTPKRQFVMTLSLYHGVSGERIWQKRYETQAEWEFSLTTRVDSASQAFWQSEYGQKIDTVFSRVSQDLDETLVCRPVIGQIIARHGNRILMNLGRRNGVKVGDHFRVVLQNQVQDRINIERITAVDTQVQITIDQVSENIAQSHLSSQDALSNIQINDLILR